MRRPNTTFDVYFGGALPPAAPDISGLTGHLKDAWRRGSESTEGNREFAWTSILEVPFTLSPDIRDLYPSAMSQTTLWFPDKDGDPYTVVFVERERGFRGDDFLRVFLRKGATVSIRIKEVDGNPSLTGITEVRLNQEDGFELVSVSAGICQINIKPASLTQAGVMNTDAQVLAGEKTFSEGIRCEDGAAGTGRWITFQDYANPGTGQFGHIRRSPAGIEHVITGGTGTEVGRMILGSSSGTFFLNILSVSGIAILAVEGQSGLNTPWAGASYTSGLRTGINTPFPGANKYWGTDASNNAYDFFSLPAAGTLNHSALTSNLDWPNSGHTGTENRLASFGGSGEATETDPADFAAASHTHTVSDITDFPTLATVATTGDYDDLSNLPTLGALAAGDTAFDAPYTETTSGDWNSSPGNVGAALDELAARLRALEP